VQLPLQGDGLSTSPLYIDDAVRVLLSAIAEGWDGVVNVGGPEVLSLRQMSDIIGGVVGKEPSFERLSSSLDAALVPDLTRLGLRMPLDGLTRFAEGLARFVPR
jgi:nucleoside-diphosphate-sugar epimerase